MRNHFRILSFSPSLRVALVGIGSQWDSLEILGILVSFDS